MKRILFVLMVLFSSGLFAQDSLFKLPPLSKKEDQLIFIISSDNWSGVPAGIEAKPLRSRGFSFMGMTDRMNREGNFGFGTGLGFMSQNVHTDANIIDTGGASMLSKIPDSIQFDINKISLNFVTAILEVRIRSNENEKGNRFKLSAGMLVGFLVQSHIKYEDKDGKIKTYDIEHLNNLQYGILGKAGLQ